MTISSLQNGLRRALMTLERSLLSSDGLRPSPTVELDTPEERLAARLVQRLRISPPIDALAIARSMATVVDKSFPVEMDGLCLDVKGIGTRPKIWLSKNNGHLRRRFTLAHEIGHIVIPWHTGSIVDDLDAGRPGAESAYRRMEAEANRFASELLMPTGWVLDQLNRSENMAGAMRTVAQVADVSFLAALIKIVRYGPPGHIVAVVENEVITRSDRTGGTRSNPPRVGTNISAVEFSAAFEPAVVLGERQSYHWWKIRDRVDVEDPAAPWRDTIEAILSTLPAEHRDFTRHSINAIVGHVIGHAPANATAEQIYARCLEVTHNRSDRNRWVAAAVAHPNFDDYLMARAIDRAKG